MSLLRTVTSNETIHTHTHTHIYTYVYRYIYILYRYIYFMYVYVRFNGYIGQGNVIHTEPMVFTKNSTTISKVFTICQPITRNAKMNNCLVEETRTERDNSK